MKPILKTLPNGLRVLLVPQPTALTATALILVGTGSLYEKKEENGLSHFLEHMCFKGTQMLPTAKMIGESFERIGAIPNAFTSPQYTGYFAKGSPSHVPIFLKLLSDIYLHSTFPEAEIQKERGVIIEEINMYEDMPQQKAAETLMKLMYGDQPAGWSIAGTKENVSGFTRQDFVDYKAKHYHADNTVVVVSGAIDPKKTFAAVATLFNALDRSSAKKKKKTIIIKQEVQHALIHKPIDQAHIVIGFHSIPFGHKDAYALSLLATILGRGLSSRLSQTLREELGAAYYVSAGNDAYTDHGVFEITAGIDKSRITEIFTRIVSILTDLKTTTVADDELDKALEYTLGIQRMGLESSDDIAGFYGAQLSMNKTPKTPLEIEKLYRAVTAADIRRIARKILTSPSIAVVGPYTPSDIDTSPFLSL
jgi:predicted Zn-dependent peptidase